MCLVPDPARDAALVRDAKQERAAASVHMAQQENDSPAFRQLNHWHGRCTRAVINARWESARLNTADKDAYQETWLRGWKDLLRLEQDAKFCGWLCSIAANVCLEMIRKPWPPRSKTAPATDDPAQPVGNAERTSRGARLEAAPPATDDPAQQVEEAEEEGVFKERVRRFIERLTENQKTVLILHYFKGMTLDDIAKVVGGAVRGQLGRALEQLREDPEFQELAAALGWFVELIRELHCEVITTERATVRIACCLTKEALVTVRVLGNRQLVRRLVDQAHHRAGPVCYAWDGRDEHGANVPPGHYTITVEAQDLPGNEQKPLHGAVAWPPPG